MAERERIVVVGTGAWGTTLAVMLARQGHEVFLWARTLEEEGRLSAARENKRFLPGVVFPAASFHIHPAQWRLPQGHPVSGTAPQ